MSVMRVTAYKQLIPLEHAVLTAYNPAAVPCGCGRVASPDRKMDADMVRRIRANVDGLTFEKLGKMANVSTHAAYEAYHGFSYKEVQ